MWYLGCKKNRSKFRRKKSKSFGIAVSFYCWQGGGHIISACVLLGEKERWYCGSYGTCLFSFFLIVKTAVL